LHDEHIATADLACFLSFFEIQLLVCDRIVNQYFSIPHQNTVFQITETSVEVQKLNNIIFSGFRNYDIGNYYRTDKLIKILGLGSFHRVLARTEKTFT
jgi:hypothetical protein